jgi:hypothetical protein
MSIYEAKIKHHDLIGNQDFYDWCSSQNPNVNYDAIIEAYEKVEYPRNRPMDYAIKKGIHVNTYYSRLAKYMALAEKYKEEQNGHSNS